MATESITVLHVVGGLSFQGGTANFVEQIASLPFPGVKSCVWMHECFQPPDRKATFVSQGKARDINRGLWCDFRAALQDVGPLVSWARRQKRLVLHAHSRAGIWASCIVHWLLGMPLVIHLHFLANRPWLYRWLCRLTRAESIYNSRKTCLHYGDDPVEARIIMPPIVWPEQAPGSSNGLPRFVACGAFVRSRHFDLLVAAFGRLCAEGVKAELQIFGLSANPLDPTYQDFVIHECQGNQNIHLESWTPNWSSTVA